MAGGIFDYLNFTRRWQYVGLVLKSVYQVETEALHP